MSLEYYLMLNNMTGNGDEYMAVSMNTKTNTLDDVFDYMTRQGSSITKAEALACFEEVIEGIISFAKQGNSVVTPLVNIRSTVKGVFADEDETFNEGIHSVSISSSPGERLRAIASEIRPEKVVARTREPILMRYYDNISETRDDEITPGKGARIVGSLLKFDEEDASQGIFFVNIDDSTETRLDVSPLRNKPKELIFNNPALPAGTYRLEVRTQIGSNTTIRKGSLSAPLTVA